MYKLRLLNLKKSNKSLKVLHIIVRRQLKSLQHRSNKEVVLYMNYVWRFMYLLDDPKFYAWASLSDEGGSWKTRQSLHLSRGSLIYYHITDNTDPRNLRRLSKSERAEGLKGLSETKPILTLDGEEI